MEKLPTKFSFQKPSLVNSITFKEELIPILHKFFQNT